MTEENYGVGYTITVFVAIVLSIALGVGAVMDVYRLTKCDFKSPYKAEVLYGLGITCPLVGGVLGWIKFEDGENK